MQNGITNSDRVLIICTDNYVSKAEEGEGGVGYERLIVTSEVVGSIDTKKFIPIIRDNSRERPVPSFLGPRMYIDFLSESEYDRKLDELLRELLGVPTNAKPSLGENPFSGQLKDRLSKQRIAGPTGVTESGKSILEDKWFESEQFDAETGISKLGINGRMELRFALHESTNKTQVDLLNAVRKSEI